MRSHLYRTPVRNAARISTLLSTLALMCVAPDVSAQDNGHKRLSSAPLQAATQRRNQAIRNACSTHKAELDALKTAADPEKARNELAEKLSRSDPKILNDEGLVCKPSECKKLVLDTCGRIGEDDTESLAGGAASLVSPGVSWQGAVVSGVTQFLAERSEEELLLWLVSEVQSGICDIPQNASFFSNSCKVIKVHGEGVLGSYFIGAIRKDLDSLPAKVISHSGALDEALANVIIDTMLAIRNGDSPLGIIAGLESNTDLVLKCGERKQEKSNSPDGQHLPCELLSLGLLASQLGDGMATDEELFEQFLERNAKLTIAYINKTCEEKNKANKTTGYCALRQISAKDDLDAVKTMLRLVFNIHKAITEWHDLGLGSATDTATRASRITTLTIDLLDSMVVLLDANSSVKKSWPTIRGGLIGTSYLVRGRYADGVRELVAVIPPDKIPKPVLQYGPLAVELAGAENATQVKAVLSAAAAPTGSWRGKRGRTMLSVSGIVGLAGGYERPLNSGNGARQAAGSFGAMGALGLDLSFPVGEKSTWGFFVPILDVGQLLSVPITTTDNSTTPQSGADFKLVQVFSPGAYLRFGLGKTPILLGAGVSFPPLLRQYSDDNGVKDLFSMMRVNAFLGVDLTLLPLCRSKEAMTPSKAAEAK